MSKTITFPVVSKTEGVTVRRNLLTGVEIHTVNREYTVMVPRMMSGFTQYGHVQPTMIEASKLAKGAVRSMLVLIATDYDEAVAWDTLFNHAEASMMAAAVAMQEATQVAASKAMEEATQVAIDEDIFIGHTDTPIFDSVSRDFGKILADS